MAPIGFKMAAKEAPNPYLQMHHLARSTGFRYAPNHPTPGAIRSTSNAL